MIILQYIYKNVGFAVVAKTNPAGKDGSAVQTVVE